MEQTLTDHEAILLVGQRLEQLEKSQLEFHKEVRQSFEELKNGYAATMANHEGRIKDLEATRADFRNKIDVTCQQVKDNKTYVILLSAIGVLLTGILIWHVAGYHI